MREERVITELQRKHVCSSIQEDSAPSSLRSMKSKWLTVKHKKELPFQAGQKIFNQRTNNLEMQDELPMKWH